MADGTSSPTYSLRNVGIKDSRAEFEPVGAYRQCFARWWIHAMCRATVETTINVEVLSGTSLGYV